MKRAFMVTYDFKGSSEKYTDLYAELKTFSGWWHYISSSWLIVSELDAKGVFNKLKPHLDNDINLLVIEVGKDRQGWLPEKAWAWLKTNLTKYGVSRD